MISILALTAASHRIRTHQPQVVLRVKGKPKTILLQMEDLGERFRFEALVILMTLLDVYLRIRHAPERLLSLSIYPVVRTGN